MKKKIYGISVVLVAGLISLSAGQSFGKDYSEGKKIFKGKCQACHSIDGDGSMVSAYHKQYEAKDFSKAASWKNLSKDKIRFVLKRGHGVMKPVQLTDAETKALIDYMTNELKK